MRKIDHSPAFDGIVTEIIEARGKKIALITLAGTLMVFSTLTGVIYGVSTESDSIVSLNLFILPLILVVAVVAVMRASQYSMLSRERMYLTRAQTLLRETFDLELELDQVKQLGFSDDWRPIKPGVAVGSTGTLSDFPNVAGRYHSIIAVKVDETSIGLFETKGETVITQID